MSHTASYGYPIMSQWDNNPIDFSDHYTSGDQIYDQSSSYPNQMAAAPRQTHHHHQHPQISPPTSQPRQRQQSSGSASPSDAQNFLFVTDNSKVGRRDARSFVMQKARAKNPWSTSKKRDGTPSPTIGALDSPISGSSSSAVRRSSKSKSPRTRPSSGHVASPTSIHSSVSSPATSSFPFCLDCQAARQQGYSECTRCASNRAAQAGHTGPGASYGVMPGPFGPAGIVHPSQPVPDPHAQWNAMGSGQSPYSMGGSGYYPNQGGHPA